MDPNLAALLGAGGGNRDFMSMLMSSLNPNAANDLRSQIGTPDISSLSALGANAPSIATASPQPALGGPQMLQTLGFGMAGAAGKAGATGLSALGEGGTNVIQRGGEASQRAIQEASQENNAAIAEWQGKSRIAENLLQQQMKEPEMDMKMMDLTGQTAAREATREDTAAYRAGLLENATARTGVARQNADTAGTRAATGQHRADTYDDKVHGDQDLKAQSLVLQKERIDQAADNFQQNLLQRAKAGGQRLGLEVAQSAAREFRNEMLLRSPVDPMTGKRELPDQATQDALMESLTSKYTKAAAPAAAAPAAAAGGAPKGKYTPGTPIWVKGQPFVVGDDGDTLVPV